MSYRPAKLGRDFWAPKRRLLIRVQAFGQIIKDDVSGFSTTSDICFISRSFSWSEETLHETFKLDTAEKRTFEMTLLPGWSGL
jgi:hypothetical protein